MNTTTSKTRTISLGDLFGMTTCTRCGGSGNYSYCQAYGTRCFKCSGSGKQLVDAKFAQDAGHALELAQRPSAKDVNVGDVVVYTDEAGTRFWRIVESVEYVAPTADNYSGAGKSLNATEWTYSGWVVFTYTDGITERHGEGHQVRRRAGWLKSMPFCQFDKTRKMIEAGMARLKAEREVTA